MIIGLVLCGLVAVLLLFGVAEHVFKSFGVPNWLAFVLVGALIGCAFIPTFGWGNVTLNIAGFVAPLMFGAVFFAIAHRTHDLRRALVSTIVETSLYISIALIIEPIASEAVSIIVIGFLCGAVGYLIAKTKLAALAAVFTGMPIGQVIASGVNVYVYGSPMRLGTASAYDAIVLAAVFAVVLFETIAAIKRTVNSRTRSGASESAEIAEEFDADEYKKYFDE